MFPNRPWPVLLARSGISHKLRSLITMGRVRRRANNQQHILFGANSSLGWSVTRHIGYTEGERGVAAGTMIYVNNVAEARIDYQLVEQKAIKDETPSVNSPAGISARESQANAGANFAHGRSRTAGMSEERRLSRIHPKSGRLMPAEDLAERTEAKVRAYPHVGAAVLTKEDWKRIDGLAKREAR